MALQCGDLGGRKTLGMLIYLLKMVIFHRYVGLPEGIHL